MLTYTLQCLTPKENNHVFVSYIESSFNTLITSLISNSFMVGATIIGSFYFYVVLNEWHRKLMYKNNKIPLSKYIKGVFEIAIVFLLSGLFCKCTVVCFIVLFDSFGVLFLC